MLAIIDFLLAVGLAVLIVIAALCVFGILTLFWTIIGRPRGWRKL